MFDVDVDSAAFGEAVDDLAGHSIAGADVADEVFRGAGLPPSIEQVEGASRAGGEWIDGGDRRHLRRHVGVDGPCSERVKAGDAGQEQSGHALARAAGGATRRTLGGGVWSAHGIQRGVPGPGAGPDTPCGLGASGRREGSESRQQDTT